jgi:transitional endoplasmic reticulum ATPase
VLCFHPYASTTNTTDIAQNLQQSCGFGNNFKFPEGSAPTAGAAPPMMTTSGNAGCSDNTQDNDLYA